MLVTNNISSFLVILGCHTYARINFISTKLRLTLYFLLLVLRFCKNKKNMVHHFVWFIIFSSLCRGFISLEGKSYVLEPSADHSDGTHWIYTAEHLNFAPGTCGHDFNISHPIEYADESPFRAFSTRVRIIKLSAFYIQLHVNYTDGVIWKKASIIKYTSITKFKVERWANVPGWLELGELFGPLNSRPAGRPRLPLLIKHQSLPLRINVLL